jgi:hypothetical protein
MTLAGSLLLLLVGAAFAVLLLTISNLRASERRVTLSRGDRGRRQPKRSS